MSISIMKLFYRTYVCHNSSCTKPSVCHLQLVLQVINAGVKRPGYEAMSQPPSTGNFFSVFSLTPDPSHSTAEEFD